MSCRASAMASSTRCSISRISGPPEYGWVRLNPSLVGPSSSAPRGGPSRSARVGGGSGGSVPPARCQRCKKYCSSANGDRPPFARAGVAQIDAAEERQASVDHDEFLMRGPPRHGRVVHAEVETLV